MTTYSLITVLEDTFSDEMETVKKVCDTTNCNQLDCFPFETTKRIEIDGTPYEMEMRLTLRQLH